MFTYICCLIMFSLHFNIISRLHDFTLLNLIFLNSYNYRWEKRKHREWWKMKLVIANWFSVFQTKLSNLGPKISSAGWLECTNKYLSRSYTYIRFIQHLIMLIFSSKKKKSHNGHFLGSCYVKLVFMYSYLLTYI